MNDDERDGLTEQERAVLAQLAASSETPLGLERDIVARLREMGEIRRPHKGRSSFWRASANIAAGLLVFASGFWTARLSPPIAEAPQERWLLLFHGVGEGSEAEHSQQAQVIGDWMRAWNERGVQLDGEPLQEERWLFATGGELTAADDAALQPASGYFFLEGADLERARAIGLSCPHLEMGGTIELRRVGFN